ncbi:hypothetical protein [Nannocystis pusilla]|uniref:hypothetical protein n=1 Tax=Nannocystis pusilla TaxID=889268 RepID=UPI003B8209D3
MTDTATALRRSHARPFDFTGRPSRGLVYVAPPGYSVEADLDAWVALGIAGAQAAVQTKRAKPRARAPKARVQARQSGRTRATRTSARSAD